MKFTLGWLKQHLDTSANAQQVAAKLTAVGLEVASVSDPAAALAAFTVAHVLEAKPHPQADRLRLCTVQTASGTVEVVCGAPNARTGMKAVYAPIGATIPSSGDVLKKAKIRGVESNGMLVSERELGLSDEHEGIIELPPSATVGAAFAAVRGLDDPVIDISVTPNRGDCLGVFGIARDLAAAGLGTLKPLAIRPVPGTFRSPIGVSLKLTPATANACSYFVGRTVRNVRNGPSPDWLQKRLRAVGLRPISALVDMTNYMSFAFARPLHVFDADKVKGNLHVRLSRAGEKLLGLNGKEYVLDDQVTAICDDSGVLAMGGVLGGEPSGCTETTKTVFIESAVFDPLRTAATGRKYDIVSDARFRFERVVDPEFVAPGIEEATRLVLEMCGGEPSELVVAGEKPAWRRQVKVRPSRVKELGGLDIPVSEASRVLQALGCTAEHKPDHALVTPPSWRPDIHGEADLVEEVVRIVGIDRVPAVSLPRVAGVPRPALSPLQKRAAVARRTLAARGLLEAVTFSFTSARLAALFGHADARLVLQNPISADLDALRPSALPNLVAAVGRNLDRAAEDVALFEVGPAYRSATPEGQMRNAVGVRQGQATPRQWAGGARPVDAFDAKADALAVLDACGVAASAAAVEPGAPSWYHPGRSGTVCLGTRTGPKTVLAHFGEIHPRILAELDIKGPLAMFEVFLESVPPSKDKGTTRPKLNAPDLLPVTRDFAFLVDAAVPAATLVRAAEKADPLIAAVSLFDSFAGKGMEAGKKSLAVAVRIQPAEKTLTDPEIEAVAQKIVAAVTKATGGTLRS
ncbi:MAG: phenylalanine--tRNA ligase subunit beta [Alphaproteobacteria bacterium]|nr:phenylalanine--tRNA ligase subunit beta [Alphaproteobacteria bacterium]